MNQILSTSMPMNGKKKNKSKEEEHQEELEFLDSFKI